MKRKLIPLSLVLIVTVVAWAVWPIGAKKARAVVKPGGGIAAGRQGNRAIDSRALSEPSAAETPARVPAEDVSGGVPHGSKEEEVEASVVQRILETLGPDWITPIEPPTVGDGPRIGGVPNGKWTLFYPANQLTDEGNFALGARMGKWALKDRDGNILRTRTFVNGKVDGIMRDRASPNDPWMEFRFDHGVQLDENGKPLLNANGEVPKGNY